MSIAQILNDFEAFLINQEPQIPSFHPYYQTALWEMMKNGGKRFRPALVFCVVNALAPQLIKNAFLPALSIECIHTYSLIHDDLPCMDNAPLRRGHATLHTKYDETLALLVGDGLNTYAFALLCQARLDPQVKLALIESLAQNAGIGGMVLGQSLDCAFEDKKLSLQELQIIHTNKTAKLIATSLQFGAIISNAKAYFASSMYEFGLKLGVYFQLRDDIIDTCFDTQQAGKTTQNDTHKNSYVNLLGLEGAKAEFTRMKKQIQKELQTFDKAVCVHLTTLLQDYFKDIE
ncbi:polyprenyl synthetase family protein [Helicobacter sp. MIT 21-1697]|uniref:polyprenyl synthetase family protein n=1 Tax=Helicobacter sp. MIT 21-1697 TaxID=2993733 RepID=UPI00224B7A03|nr:polyprenyl synthetase family protein [Helicobacter sp. MIT 21-1697]MCX2717385.1 polyprenyl synthetase family protein [Helicobacter sp. MIT 21-1697]